MSKITVYRKSISNLNAMRRRIWFITVDTWTMPEARLIAPGSFYPEVLPPATLSPYSHGRCCAIAGPAVVIFKEPSASWIAAGHRDAATCRPQPPQPSRGGGGDDLAATV